MPAFQGRPAQTKSDGEPTLRLGAVRMPKPRPTGRESAPLRIVSAAAGASELGQRGTRNWNTGKGGMRPIMPGSPARLTSSHIVGTRATPSSSSTPAVGDAPPRCKRGSPDLGGSGRALIDTRLCGLGDPPLVTPTRNIRTSVHIFSLLEKIRGDWLLLTCSSNFIFAIVLWMTTTDNNRQFLRRQ